MDGSSSISRLRLGHQRARHRQHLLLAAGERAGNLLLALLQARKQLEHLINAAAAISPVGARVAAHFEVLAAPLICWKTRRPSGQSAMPVLHDICSTAWTCVRSLPLEVDAAARAGVSSPATVFSVVDLPAPFAPISVTTSPSSTEKEMPLIA